MLVLLSSSSQTFQHKITLSVFGPIETIGDSEMAIGSISWRMINKPPSTTPDPGSGRRYEILCCYERAIRIVSNTNANMGPYRIEQIPPVIGHAPRLVHKGIVDLMYCSSGLSSFSVVNADVLAAGNETDAIQTDALGC
jgi:hypothetical protein